jgi:hypothetical protein
MLQARKLDQIQIPELILPQNWTEARANLEKAAYFGFAKAQVAVARFMELGDIGYEVNLPLSLHYSVLAARQCDPEGEIAVSKWFLCGLDGTLQKNEELAFSYGERSAATKHAIAEFALGYYYEIGVHVPVNHEKALYWYHEALSHGYTEAQSRINDLKNSQAKTRKDHEQYAINGIKSKFGSKRVSSRPDRQKVGSSVPPMPNINEISPSEYSQSSAGGATPHSAQAPPSRLSTTTPYPVSDGPPTVPAMAPYGERPATVAPYPLENGPPKPLGGLRGPAGGFAPELRSASAAPIQRPSSAFNINPNVYSKDYAAGPPGGRYHEQGPDFRPYTAMDNLAPGYHRPPPNQRSSSGPVVLGPQDYRRGSASPPRRPAGAYDNPVDGKQTPKPDLPKLDIGYVAPIDVKKQRPVPATAIPTSQPTYADLGYQAPLNPKPPPKQHSSLQSPTAGRPTNQGLPIRPGSAGRSSPHPQGGYPVSAGQNPAQTSQYPPRRDSRPAEGAKPKPVPTGLPSGPKPPTKDSNSSNSGKPSAVTSGIPTGSAAPKPPPKATAGATSASKPPGKGPKTFDAMGIPTAKKEEECVSITSSPY